MIPAITDREPWIAIVGEFLGAGETTLILAAAKELERRGMRSAVILNDRGNQLVDTGYAMHNEMQSGEVSGGCFCCKLSDLLQVMEELRAYDLDVIFAEPVGSMARREVRATS
jgi:G3E family GTPase